MKKIFLAIAILASVQVIDAQQVRTSSEAKAAVEAAKAATQNPKKNIKPATWLKLGQTFIDAYNAPAGNGIIGQAKQEVELLLGNDKPKSSSEVVVGGKTMVKDEFETRNYYYQNGQLAMIEITKPAIEDALDQAVQAYQKAYQVDAKQQKVKDVQAAIKMIAGKYSEEAFCKYSLGDFASAAKLFSKSAEALAVEPVNELDTMSLYNAGFAAWSAKDFDFAKTCLEKCIASGYYGADGEAFAKLADIASRAQDAKNQKEYLEKGFSLYPQSQSILVGLINYYLSSGDDPQRLFELLNVAKKNEPGNASLYYVEGNINRKLGKEEAAIAAYAKCAEINPKYEFGYVGLGIHYYEKAIEIQDKAQKEMDDAKYMALTAEFEKTLKACIEPFEKAFELSPDPKTKKSIAEYLKNACFRFRSESDEFQKKYDKYNSFLNS